MKIKSIFVAILLMTGVVVAPAHASERPIIESFNFSPHEIDVTAENTIVTFELVASHPNGIENIATTVTLKNSKNDTLAATISRTDLNLDLKKVTFRGSVTVPRNFNPGVYAITVSGIKNNPIAGYQYENEETDGGKIRTIVGAEKGLLIRSGGDLNFAYDTFVGPAFDTSLGISYNNPIKFSSNNLPIWRVGENFDPSNYYELRVPTLSLNISSSTETVCSSNGNILKFLREGNCMFVVSTSKTKDYLAKTNSQSVTIGAARIKSTLNIIPIPNQDVKDLGKSIEIGRVYSASEGWVLPQSATPTICFASGFYVKLIAGGTCKLTYQTAATSTYLASDLYTVSFEILKDGQPVVVPTPASTPTATPSPTAKPVVNKSISCIKGKKTVSRTGTNPKCPKGYKVKK